MTETYYGQYGVLAGDHIDASGTSIILGSFGSFNAITGGGTVIATDQPNIGASISDALLGASGDYDAFSLVTPDTISGVTEIGGMTFLPGTYQFTAPNVTLSNNTITLDGDGSYIFQFLGNFSTVTTSTDVSIIFMNGAHSTQTYWIIAGNVNLQSQSGNVTNFNGLFLCPGTISMGVNSTNIGSMAAFSGSGVITLNNNKITATTVQQPREVSTQGYINIESTLADNQSISINASNTFGGIDINAGLGGITIDTTNSLSITAAAASQFITSNGNLNIGTVGPTGGLLNLDGFSGINIGINANSNPINIGTTGPKNINIGNLQPGTQVSIDAGGTGSNFTLASTGAGQDLTLALTGNNDSSIVLSSQGTGPDAIFLNTFPGGIVASSNDTISLATGATGANINLNAGNGQINLVTNVNSGAAINLNSTANSGGISLTAGNQGVVINSQFGTIGIGNFNADTILFGTAGPNTLTIGNDTPTTRIFERYGPTGGIISTQAPEIALTGSTGLSPSDIFQKIYTINNAGATTLTVDSIGSFVSAIPGLIDNDSIDFIIINTGAGTATIAATLGSGTVTGTATVIGGASGYFRIRFMSSLTAYTIYRLS